MNERELYTLEGAARWIGERYPILAAGLRNCTLGSAPALAHAVYALYVGKTGKAAPAITAGLESFAAMSIDFLRLQAGFLRSGSYRPQSEEELFQTIYADEQLMAGAYLDALLLSYCFWPNHSALLSFFESRFLPRCPASGRVLEIGVGHGLMALMTMQALSGCEYAGFDLSLGAKRYSERLWRSAGVDATKADVRVAQFSAASATAAGTAPWDCALCCEVLEHVAQPAALLHELREALKPGGLAFITSVANIAAQDHIFLFRDVEHLHKTLEEGGFGLVDELALPLPGPQVEGRQPFNYAAILERR